MEIDESSFTGEINPAKKSVETLSQHVSLQERSNMALMGTLVRCGKGKVSLIWCLLRSSSKNQSIDSHCQSFDWFLYDDSVDLKYDKSFLH